MGHKNSSWISRNFTIMFLHRAKWQAVLCLIVASVILDRVLLKENMRLLYGIHSPSYGDSIINPYSTRQIAETAPYFTTFHPRLLVFNGTTFEVYNLCHNETPYIESMPFCGRCGKLVPLLVHALKSLDPARFQPGQPVFQLLFSDGDYASTWCNHKKCPVKEFVPLPLFGSAPAYPWELPTVKAFPNWFYLSCLYDYILLGVNHCESWDEPVDRTIPFEDLIPQIIWRGSDFSFLADYTEFNKLSETSRGIEFADGAKGEFATQKLMDNYESLPPRWRAVALSAHAEVRNETSWMDAKFTGIFEDQVHQLFGDHKAAVSANQTMSPREMSKYRYQIDLGGGGGTSWRGTMTKLGFNGLLFHHVTRTKDWFYDDMKPGTHYIPVVWSLHGLKEKFLWAEKHPEEAKEIANAATELFEYFMSEEYMEKTYRNLYIDYLQKVLDSYRSTSDSWQEIREYYEDLNFDLFKIGDCDDVQCRMLANDGETYNVFQHHKEVEEETPQDPVILIQ